MQLVQSYFTNLSALQQKLFNQLLDLYFFWNQQINVISRKDLDHFYERHVLHSLGIAKICSFSKGSIILDVGTGGGFPGIPLAILFPEVEFVLIDSIAKKIKVVKEVCYELGLNNIVSNVVRAEDVHSSFDFIVSRAVTDLSKFVPWINNKISSKQINPIPNGLLYLKGGDLTLELRPFKNAEVFELKEYFKEDFFETKKVVYLPI